MKSMILKIITLIIIFEVLYSCSKGGGGTNDAIVSLNSFYSLDDLSTAATNAGKIPTYTTSGAENGLISMGDLSACVVMTSGAIKCWGYNQSFQLGNTNAGTNNQVTPVTVNILTEKAVAVSAALNHTCAFLSTGLKCWGSQNNGKLGNRINNNSNATQPQDVLNLNGNQIKMMVTGDEHVCVLFSASQQVSCWGLNNQGQMAQSDFTNPFINGVNIPLPESVKLIATSDHSVCAVTISGGLYCWGSSITTTSSPNPILIDTNVKNISSGEKDHFCYINSSDAIKCFGKNDKLQLGNSTSSSAFNKTPNLISGISNAKAIVAGAFHSCAITNDGASVYCWGDNSKGQLGSGSMTPTQSSAPVSVVGLPSAKVIDIAAADNNTCALLDNDDVYCWGSNNNSSSNVYGDNLGIKNPPSLSNTAIKILNRNEH
ncbi:RCC1 domain-containing protein [Fluviispira vulneris]|uniref:RCC1 domain-containing protein n=1 Tax=Fluviispira vulneris TaxID=2763012 RepID=UPI0016482D4E|nr:hypothetical protein [Fluviispira vulneris]